MAGIGVQWHAIDSSTKLGIAQSNNAAATTIAGYQAFGTISKSGFDSNAAIAGKIGAPTITNTTTTVTDSNNVTRHCEGGNSTTTTASSTAGAANC